jgi:cholest-4-en-3-one 26-monooxygenase
MSTTASPTARPTVDLLDPELYQRNPHEVWSWMREHEPVYRDERNGLWGISRHADAIFVERRAERFPSAHAYRAISTPSEMNMIAQDDPGHKSQRMLVQRFFAPGVLARRTDELRDTVGQILDALFGRPGERSGAIVTVEVIDAIAGRLPAILTCRLLGYPDAAWPLLKGWSEQLMRTDMRERSGEVFMDFVMANLSLRSSVKELIAAKRAEPGDDLLTVWSQAELNGAPMPFDSIFHEVGLFVSGGSETTRTTIAHGLRAFVDHPDQWEALRDEPSLVDGAVEEVIRWVTPLNNFFRRCIQPTEIGDRTINRGDRVILLYPSANRDEEVFTDPFRFDITRSPNPHISFGNGPHTCIGAPLARLSLRVLFAELAARCRDLTVVSEPDVEANIFARAVRSFDLRATVR